MKILSKKELRSLVPYSGQHIARLEKAGRFPRRIRLGTGVSGRVGWLLSDIEAWVAERISERDRVQS